MEMLYELFEAKVPGHGRHPQKVGDEKSVVELDGNRNNYRSYRRGWGI